MPDIISPDDFPLTVGSFHGGQEHGPCIQFVTQHALVHLKMDQIEELICMLQNWHQRHAQWRMDRAEKAKKGE